MCQPTRPDATLPRPPGALLRGWQTTSTRLPWGRSPCARDLPGEEKFINPRCLPRQRVKIRS